MGLYSMSLDLVPESPQKILKNRSDNFLVILVFFYRPPVQEGVVEEDMF